MAQRSNNSNRRGNKEREEKYGKTKNYKGKNRQQNKVDTHNGRKDLLDDGKAGMNNNPAWYYTDEELAEQMSRFPMTQFPGLAQYEGSKLPVVMRICLSPHIVNTNYSRDLSSDDLKTLNELKLEGINLAAQKWWSMLTTYSGRGSTYTKNDLAILFAFIGEIISNYEFIRRAFGVLTTYSQRNRALPRLIVNAMGVDFDDFIKNSPNYRLRMNTLVAMINQLPIPSNVTYFAKCQDLYQHIYMDSNTEMAQFYVHVPGTTWMLDEELLQSGSVLLTHDFVQQLDTTDKVWKDKVTRTDATTLGDYIDILEKQVSLLLNSSTYSIIYADILNVASKVNLSLWHFDTIKEDYVVVPEYNEFALMQIHNMSYFGPIAANGSDTAAAGRPTRIVANDVVCDATADVVVQATALRAKTTATSTAASLVRPVKFEDGANNHQFYSKPMLDLHSINPDRDMRIDSTRYIIVMPEGSKFMYQTNGSDVADVTGLVFPDHFCTGISFICMKSSASTAEYETVSVKGLLGYLNNYGATVGWGDVDTQAILIGMYNEHPPVLLRESNLGVTISADAITVGRLSAVNYPIAWDVDCWTELDATWLDRVANLTYLGLFDLR